MTRRKDLYGAPKGAPLQNAWQMPFFSSLFSRAVKGRAEKWALAPVFHPGAKAQVFLGRFAARLKAVPFQRCPNLCDELAGSTARLKPCPDTNRIMKHAVAMTHLLVVPRPRTRENLSALHAECWHNGGANTSQGEAPWLRSSSRIPARTRTSCASWATPLPRSSARPGWTGKTFR